MAYNPQGYPDKSNFGVKVTDLLDEVIENTKPVPKEPAGALDAALEATEKAKKSEPVQKVTVTPADAPAAVYRLMTFGKYQGRRLDTIPQSYLYWLLTIKLTDSLRASILEVIKYTAPKAAEAPVVAAPLAPVNIPAGFQRLPAGITRSIRINKDWIIHGRGKPVIVTQGRTEIYYNEVVIEGQAQMKCGVTFAGGCGDPGTRTAAVETRSSLLVK